MAAKRNAPTEEDLERVRDAALECVEAAEDLWRAVTRIPAIDPALAATIDPKDRQLAQWEDRIEKKWLRVSFAVHGFDQASSVACDLVDVAAAKAGTATDGASAHRDARNLAA